jgi:hypothetical protein
MKLEIETEKQNKNIGVFIKNCVLFVILAVALPVKSMIFYNI